MRSKTLAVLLSAFVLMSFVQLKDERATLYIIGDSTVRNPNAIGQLGWGSHIAEWFDTSRLAVSNQAMAGRSTRTFVKEGRWERVLSTMKKGDFVIMQFGHNEGSKPDTGRAGYRGVIRGTGEDSIMLVWADGKPETVHSYGWYLRKFIREAKAKGATPIVASMIPRNQWKDGKVVRSTKDFGLWAKQIAEEESAFFIDLNGITADKYDLAGPEKVKEYFSTDHTHTSVEGARINAESVVSGIKSLPACALNQYLK